MQKHPYVLLLLFVLLFPCFSQAEGIDDAFFRPADEARPWVYWYRMNGNITKEGLVADLDAMQQVGVGGVFLMDIGIHPAGPVAYFSDDWFDLTRYAVSEAKKRNIAVNFHCPGWSASGGPWVTPEQGMQEITWSETFVDGKADSIVLAQPSTTLGFYRDIAVLAFPTPVGDGLLPDPVIQDVDGKVIPNVGAAFDNDVNTTATLPGVFDLVFEQEYEFRSLLLRAARANGSFNATVEAWDASQNAFREIARLRANVVGPFSPNLGDTAFPKTKTNRIRIDMGNRRGNRAVIEEVRLSTGFRPPGWTHHAGFSTEGVAVPAGTKKDNLVAETRDFIKKETIVDLTEKLREDGKLDWTPPPGNWTILRIGHTPTGVHLYPPPHGGAGLECDKMSWKAVDDHYDHFVKRLFERFGTEAAKGIKGYHVDSYEAGWQNWTENFPEDFRIRHGYDILKFLPTLTGRIVDDRETTERFLWDFRRTIGDLFAENHYARLTERSHQDGLYFSTEPYGGPFNFLQVGGKVDIPMIEFWMPSSPRADRIPFPPAFAGHTNGRRIIGAESFTSGVPTERWNLHPLALKAMGDYIYCSGVNHMTIHVYAHQPFIDNHLRPGLTCGLNGIHFDRNTTWWDHGAKEWVDYLTRCHSMLQQGEHVADVLYFQGSECPDGAHWLHPSVPYGYDFDACNDDVLFHLEVKDHRVVLPSGKDYRYLVLPQHGRLTDRVLGKIKSLLESGATLLGAPVGVGASPSLGEHLLAKTDRAKIIREIWGDSPAAKGERPVGKGRIFWGHSFEEILKKDALTPDFQYDKKSGLMLNCTHRKTSAADVYFVANGKEVQGLVACRFRVKDGVPSLYCPSSGRKTPCPVFYRTDDGIEIPLYFESSGSMFVVFERNVINPAHVLAVKRNGANLFEKSTFVETPANEAANVSPRNAELKKNHSVAFWCKPKKEIALQRQTKEGVHWSDQNWVVFPSPGHALYGLGHSGSGISVGTNGVVLFEHWEFNVPPLLTYRFPTPKKKWIHIVVVYDEGKPTLYLDGKKAAEGWVSEKIVHPSVPEAADQTKLFLGQLSDIELFDKALSDEQVEKAYGNSVVPQDEQDETDDKYVEFIAGPKGTASVLFRQSGEYEFTLSDGKSVRSIVTLPEPIRIDHAWELSFPQGWGAPEKVDWPELISWTEHSEEGIKYFSGTATYRTKFTVPPESIQSDGRVFLNLGQVDVIATVKVNGHSFGTLWMLPFEVDVTAALTSGDNDLEIDVTNLWPNRMIGDEQYPADTSGNLMITAWPSWLTEKTPRPEPRRMTFTALRAWEKDEPLLSSGLLGPVTIRFAKYVSLNDK